MPTALAVTAPLLLAAVLVLSAMGKLRTPERARDAFDAMGVPAWLNRPVIIRAHPWGEIVLAVLVLTLPGVPGVVAAAAGLLLMVVYVALVVRALRSPVDVDCACFGSLGGDRVTGATVWRNIWLATVAAVALWAALEGRSVVTRIAALSPSEAWWLVALAAAGLTVALVLGTAASRAQPSSDLSLDEGELEDYVRTPTPAVPVLLADGSETDLRALSRQRAQLLLFVSETCGSCSSVIEAAPTWRAALPQLDVRLVVGQPPESSSLTSTEHPQSVHDPRRSVRESFVIAGTPAALLLGVDGYLAGGPVAGSADVSQFIAEIQHELEGASEAS